MKIKTVGLNVVSRISLILTLFTFPLIAVADCVAVSVNVSQPMWFGKIVAPDSGQTETISLSADGIRSVPSNLKIGNTNTTHYGDQYQEAIVTLNGLAGCDFQVDIYNISSGLSNITLQGINGTSLDSNVSGATGTLSDSGTAEIQIGASLGVSRAEVGDLSKSFSVRVTVGI